ncbi:MAG: glycoside hydrolase family protein [Methylobacillus sp.]|jgi:GH24 family phage-related lysozyme (muramidase)|nr:glycoside hydrolase family protein [Methylobacillus sp.]
MEARRYAIEGLKLSAAGLIAILAYESFIPEATIPVKGDPPTIGFGSTVKEDGTPVKLGEKIDPVSAVKRVNIHLQKDEVGLKKCVTAPLSQTEYDVLADFAYNYGLPTACKSSMVRYINQGNYEASCNAYTLYKYAGGYDCSTMINGERNKRCWGVWERSLERKAKCLAN